MNLFKVFGGILVLLGFIFRAISLAYFQAREKHVGTDVTARRRFEASKRRALWIDAGFILFGFYVLVGH